MAGVFRPYTLVDVLGTMNQQIGALNGAQTITGFGVLSEVDESSTITDSATGTAVTASTAVWDAATWGTFVWT